MNTCEDEYVGKKKRKKGETEEKRIWFDLRDKNNHDSSDDFSDNTWMLKIVNWTFFPLRRKPNTEKWWNVKRNEIIKNHQVNEFHTKHLNMRRNSAFHIVSFLRSPSNLSFFNAKNSTDRKFKTRHRQSFTSEKQCSKGQPKNIIFSVKQRENVDCW